MSRLTAVDAQPIRRRVEKLVAWLSLLFTLVGVWEKASHYVKLAKQQKRRKRHPLGFRA